MLGGGFAPGMTILCGGPPGAGKSTLLLQSGVHVAENNGRVMYLSGEESIEQIKDRAVRLRLPEDKLLVASLTNVEEIIELSRDCSLVIVDSIQTTYHAEVSGAPGGVAQVRSCAMMLNAHAKETKTAIVMVGHVTKDDLLAGPMAIKHVVDATLLIAATDDSRYRILRAEKNRYGAASETGIFAMTATGLRVVDNPGAIFLSRAVQDAPGSVVTALWEGTRPLLVEVQALLDKSTLSNPRRVTIGLDDKRVAMLMAVLQRRGGISVHDQDVYVNIAGGVEVSETSADLAILLAAVSSLTEKPVGDDVLVFGEVGLSGEVRPAPNGVERLREAAKLGMRRAVVPAANCPREGIPGMDIHPVLTLERAVTLLDELVPLRG